MRLNILKYYLGTMTGCISTLRVWLWPTQIMIQILIHKYMHLGYPGKLQIYYSLETGEILGWGALFNYRHFLKRDSAESCQLLRFSVIEKRNAWISKGEDYRQHFTEPIAVHILHWLDPLFCGGRGRRGIRIMGEALPKFWWTPFLDITWGQLMNYSPYHCHLYWLSSFSIIYFR